jgi:hypothetical protein
MGLLQGLSSLQTKIPGSDQRCARAGTKFESFEVDTFSGTESTTVSRRHNTYEWRANSLAHPHPVAPAFRRKDVVSFSPPWEFRMLKGRVPVRHREASNADSPCFQNQAPRIGDRTQPHFMLVFAAPERYLWIWDSPSPILVTPGSFSLRAQTQSSVHSIFNLRSLADVPNRRSCSS